MRSATYLLTPLFQTFLTAEDSFFAEYLILLRILSITEFSAKLSSQLNLQNTFKKLREISGTTHVL